MPPSEVDILNTMQVLTKWNPLGERAAEVDDLDDYRTEAPDILFHISVGLSGKSPTELVQSVLNSAFNLSLTLDECREPAQQIVWRTSFHK